MRCNGFCFACALEDEELREDGNGLEEDGERPEYFCEGVGVVEEDSEEQRGTKEVFHTEGVDRWVVRRPEAWVETQ